MKRYLYRVVGKILMLIGIVLFLFPISVFNYWIEHPEGIILPSLSEIIIQSLYPVFGFFLFYSGYLINIRFREKPLYLIDRKGIIHSAFEWKKGNETGLYCTLCERIASVNQTSQETAYAGYKIAIAKTATCRECCRRKGGVILEAMAHNRSY